MSFLESENKLIAVKIHSIMRTENLINVLAYVEGELYDLAFWRKRSLCVIGYLINSLRRHALSSAPTRNEIRLHNYYFAVKVIYICIFGVEKSSSAHQMFLFIIFICVFHVGSCNFCTCDMGRTRSNSLLNRRDKLYLLICLFELSGAASANLYSCFQTRIRIGE